ncbi:MAG: glycosyltransferase [Phycisphaerales bacterium JB063]
MTARDRPLRVVHIGTADRVGGAARAQWRMHEALLGAGVDSRILCGHQSVEDHRVDRVPAMRTLPAKALRKLAHKAEWWTGREYHLLPWGRSFVQHPWVRRADVIHLHNLHGGFFPIKCLPRLARVAPLVWSVHDLWPTTAHCYFPQMTGCRCWTGESVCIDPRQDDWYPLMRETSRWLWQRKREIVSNARPTMLAQSAFTGRWLGDAPLTRDRETVRIPYALDVDVFAPTEKAEARRLLGIQDDRPVAMFSAVSLSHERKGGADVLQAARAAAERLPEGLTLLAVGASAEVLETSVGAGKLRVVALGQIDDDARLALAYSAADVFVGASKVETFGQVFSEASACGTPGVAYDTSGVADAVRDGETGVLVALGDVEALGAAVHALLVDEVCRAAMAQRGRELCEAAYAYPVVGALLLGLYERRIREFAALSHGLKGGA